MNVSQILNAAADKIERDGWIQSVYCSDGWAARCGNPTQTCAVGAILFAATGVPFPLIGEQPEVERLVTRLATATGFPNVPAWNDEPGRTKAEVIALLRAVAATEKAREARLLPATIPEPVHA